MPGMTIQDKKKIRVAVGLSGGVDSAVTAHLLLQEGYRVFGITMQTWDGSVSVLTTERSGCFGPGEIHDIQSARQHAERLGIEHHIIPMAEEYREEILGHFRAEYMAGRTPNPCVRCNRLIKFGGLLRRAAEIGLDFDFFATGHYARVQISPANGRFLLKKGLDARKDQSYFLSHLGQDQLSRCLFPLGELTKVEVRELARQMNWLDLVEKRESQDFIDGGKHDPLFQGCTPRPGAFVDQEGRVLGSHRGIIHYTIGQRKGLGLNTTGEPLYVLRIDEAENTVTVGPREKLLSRRFFARDLNWISIEKPGPEPMRLHARIRQQHQEAPAVVFPPREEGDTGLEVVFDEPQLSITPGQTVVFYDGETVVGAGTIA